MATKKRIKRKNNEGCWFKKNVNGYEYDAFKVTLGYDPITGKVKTKVFTGKTQKEVKAKYENFLKTQSYNSNDKLTVGAFYHFWMFEYRKGSFKPSTLARYEGIYRNYILSNSKFADMKLTELNTEFLQSYYNYIVKNGRPAEGKPDAKGNPTMISIPVAISQTKTVNKLLKSVLNDAVKLGRITINPCTNVIFPNNYNIEENPGKIDNFLEEEEIQDLVRTIRGSKVEGIILLGLGAGMRLGEILALTPNDIDFVEGYINISKSLKRVPKITSEGKKIYEYDITVPKTKNSIRRVPLIPSIAPVIKAQITKNKTNKIEFGELYCDDGLIFCNKDGTPLDTKLPNRHLKTLCKKAGIDKDIHFHSLRHVYISTCIMKNIDAKTVSTLVGHSDVRTTLNIYTKISNTKLKEDTNKINEIFKGII